MRINNYRLINKRNTHISLSVLTLLCLIFILPVFGQINRIEHAFYVNPYGEPISIDLSKLSISDSIISEYETGLIRKNGDKLLFLSSGQIKSYHKGIIHDHYEIKKAQVKPLIYFDEAYYVIVNGSDLVLYDSNNQVVDELRNVKPEHFIKLIYEGGDIHYVFKDRMIEIGGDTLVLPFTATDGLILSNGEVLISSSLDGLWSFRDKRLKKYYIPRTRFPERIVKLVAYDDNLFILTRAGDLFLWESSNQIFKKLGQKVDDFHWDKWGVVWYKSGNKILSKRTLLSDALPEIEIKSVKINGKQTIGQSYKAKSGDIVSISLNGKYTPQPELIYQMRSNLDNLWKDCNAEYILNSVNAGLSHLEFRAGHQGVFSKPEKIELIVSKGLFSNIWFYVFGSFGLLLLALLISLFRLRQNERLLIKEKEKLKLELELTKNLQRYGQLKMNPHFIFNALNGINGMIASGDNAIARKAVSKFSSIMRTLLNQSSEEKISLSDELAFLESYLLLEQLILKNKFDFEINFEERDGEIYPMLIQPLVENAIKHGIQAVEEKGKIIIDIEAIPKYYKVLIKDTGPGFINKSIEKRDAHLSKATGIIMDRLRTLDKWKLYPSLEYTRDETNSPHYTVCTIYIPK